MKYYICVNTIVWMKSGLTTYAMLACHVTYVINFTLGASWDSKVSSWCNLYKSQQNSSMFRLLFCECCKFGLYSFHYCFSLVDIFGVKIVEYLWHVNAILIVSDSKSLLFSFFFSHHHWFLSFIKNYFWVLCGSKSLSRGAKKKSVCDCNMRLNMRLDFFICWCWGSFILCKCK